ncbi:MAG: RES family NAD+ phosphorylase [Reichenbachiella sp.]|uniref:RES family NAD+ phosphorylase n=1 Tax=Reichenbachiella sp. TaxID=2184521 RepID=UPI0032655A7E
MIVYRITKEEFSGQLASSGRPNRWNRQAQHVIYTSSSISLCALELLAHTGGIRPAGNFSILHIQIDAADSLFEISAENLPAHWQGIHSYSFTQEIGSAWFDSRETLMMKIPSAIITQEHNYILNVEHPKFNSGVKIINVSDFIWDHRFPEN